MKKLILSALALAFATTAVTAQGLVSKKGEAYLPEAGDYALSIDAVPFLQLMNFNNGSSVQAAPVMYTLQGKKFESATKACRYGVSVGLSNSANFNMVSELEDGAATGSNDLVEDRNVVRNTALFLSAGQELRKGNTRVQGTIGADAFIGFTNRVEENEFGNDENDLADGTYILEDKSGLGFSIGARAFVGAEYFIAPKVSLGFEVGLALSLQTQAAGEQTVLEVDRTGGSVDTDENTIDGTSSSRTFGLQNNLTGGMISLNFHF